MILLYQQFSDEEVENMECPWENPLFENTDQLMDERYITENNTVRFYFYM